jgi:hypothetical protein
VLLSHWSLKSKAAIGRKQCQWRQRAHTVNWIVALLALAAREMPHEREISCRRAAGEPAIHADRSEDQRSNSQSADYAAIPYFTSHRRGV